MKLSKSIFHLKKRDIFFGDICNREKLFEYKNIDRENYL